VSVITAAPSASASAMRASHEDERLLGVDEQARGLFHRILCRRWRHAGLVALHVREVDGLVEFGLLQAYVEADIGGAVGLRRRNLVAAHNGFDRCPGGAWLVVPLGVVADQRALIFRSVNPVNPRTTLFRIARARCAQNEHRRATAPCVEDRHSGVQQTDVGMERDCHRALRHLGVTLRNANGVLFVQADHHLRIAIAQIVHKGVVQAAIARAGRQRDVAHIKPAQHFGHSVRRPAEFSIGGKLQLVLVVEAGRCDALNFTVRGVAHRLLPCCTLAPPAGGRCRFLYTIILPTPQRVAAIAGTGWGR
jgi:hypothetical protein